MEVSIIRKLKAFKIKLEDRTLNCTMNKKALNIIDSEFKGLEKVMDKYSNPINIFEIAAILLYAGIKVNNESITLDESRSIIVLSEGRLLDSIFEASKNALVSIGGLKTKCLYEYLSNKVGVK